jgi:hypothetical protein
MERRAGVIGIVGWTVLVGLLLAWEGLAIAFDRPDWPSSSDMLRAVTRPVVGRWLLFGAWLWLGWHLFMRGWSFFLAGHGARTPPRVSKSAGQLLTQVVLPLLACYLGWLALVAIGRRERIRRAEGSTSPRGVMSPRPRVWHIAGTVAGGYATFVALIGIYAVVAGRVASGVFGASVRQGAFLAFAVALPVFLLASVAQAVQRSRRARTGPGPP